jgi:predicted HTH domain antitoxin
MVLKNHPLSGEERKIVSTRLYQSEFLYFKKICEMEGKSVNTKLKEVIREEIKKRFGGILEGGNENGKY